LLFVLTPLFSRRERAPDVDQDELNLAVFRQQLEELQADLAAGNLDDTQYQAARRDLERELLYDVHATGAQADSVKGTASRVTALMLVLAIPASTIGLYRYLGDGAIIPVLETAASTTAPQSQTTGHPSAPGGQMPPMDVLVERLAKKMDENPNDLNGWLMLGRSYFAIGQPQKALGALEKAYALGPQNPNVMVAYAQALANNDGGRLTGRPAELVRAALEIDANNVTGRWLDGIIAYRAGEYPRAIKRWESILGDLDPNAKQVADLRGLIADARERAGMLASPSDLASRPARATDAPPPEAAAETSTREISDEHTSTGVDASGASITVKVGLAEPLWPEVDVSHTLFVYAKAVSGPPMPLAVQRLRAGDLPVTVTLDDSMAMMPAMRLSNFREVTVGARISRSGKATPESGDLEGEVSPVEPAQSGPIEITIDRVRP
jgi:cytochrome c-type biogenesis protein CcmH